MADTRVRVDADPDDAAAAEAALDEAAAALGLRFDVGSDRAGHLIAPQEVLDAATLPPAVKTRPGRGLTGPTATGIQPDTGPVGTQAVISTINAGPQPVLVRFGPANKVTPDAVAEDGSSVTFTVPTPRGGRSPIQVVVVTPGGKSNPVMFNLT